MFPSVMLAASSETSNLLVLPSSFILRRENLSFFKGRIEKCLTEMHSIFPYFHRSIRWQFLTYYLGKSHCQGSNSQVTIENLTFDYTS